MNSRTTARAVLSAALAFILAAAFIPFALANSSDGDANVNGQAQAEAAQTSSNAQAATYEKTEVVYARLDGHGDPQALYVVNEFAVDQGGVIEDAGPYDSVKGLNQELGLEQDGETVTFETDAGTVYYQGTAAGDALELPWDISINYELEGKYVVTEELGGATGDLTVNLFTQRNDKVDEAFAESFMLQITFTLDGAACRDIVAEGATIVSSGTDRTVAFTVLPGHDGSFELSAQVENFAMDGVQIAALPYSSVVEMPDTGEMESGLTELSDAISQLNEGTAELADGIAQLDSGASNLASGASSFGSGLSRLDGSSSAILNASERIEGALQQISAGLAGVDLSQLASLEQLPGALSQLADGLDQISQASSAVGPGYSAALASLDAAIDGLLANAPSAEEIGALQAAVAGTEQEAAVAKLVAVYAAAQTVKGTYDATEAAFAGADEVLSSSATALATQAEALRMIASSLESSLGSGSLDQLSQLSSGIGQLAGQYGQFHDGLSAYASGLSTLASNYASLSSGASQLADGVGQTASGTRELASGVAELHSFTSDLPAQMRSQIDELMADYEFPEFEPRSFVSPKNERTVAVQFVMTTPAIEAPEAESEEPAEEAEQSAWDRFIALFE